MSENASGAGVQRHHAQHSLYLSMHLNPKQPRTSVPVYVLPIAVCLLSTLLLLIPLQACAAMSKAFLLKERTLFENELAGHQHTEAVARQALTSGESAIAYAQQQNNPQAKSVAEQAVTTAQTALKNAITFEAEDQRRIDALDHALHWTDLGDAYGIPVTARGDIMVRVGGQRFSLDMSKPLTAGQEVIVGQHSTFEIISDKGATLTIGPDSDFIYISPEHKIPELISGLLHLVEDASINPNDEQSIDTSYGIVAVRGTEIVVSADADGASFFLLSGEMHVTNKISKTSMDLHAGEMVRATRVGFVESPQQFDLNHFQSWWEN